MVSGITSAPAPSSAPALAPVATAPMPTPAPAPTMQNGGMSMQNGGMSMGGSGKVTDILKRINVVELGFGVLGAAALYYTIYYYRYNLTISKTFRNEIENKVDDLSIKVTDVQSAVERDKTKETTQGFF
ncbi:MAG: hypothetical protein FJZ56_02735 [Chlamydiae bacterium]|nr:hypothetical protein [Chlamydiota bacterium]